MRTLERRLGLSSVIGISIGAMLGSGLFVLPGLAVAQAGPSVWLAYVVAGLCVLPAALSKSELATAMPVSGGTYVYIDQTLGPLASTIGGLGLWLSLLLKSAFALVGFGAYLGVLTDVPVLAVGIALLALIITINILGVRKVGRMQIWTVMLSMGGLIGLALWGGRSFDASRLQASFSGGTLGFLATISFVYISYAGVTKVAAIAEEVKDPGRNLPLGILVSLGIVTVLYGAVTLVLVGNVPLERLEGDLKPIHTLAVEVGGPSVGVLAAVLGVLTMTSMANSGLLASSRFPFAMSRDHLLPSFLGVVSPRFMTPVLSITVTGLLMGAAILFLDVARIAKLASALMIVGFMVENLAVIVLRESGIAWYKPSFRAPVYPLLQILGLVIGLGLLFMLGWVGVIALGGITVTGFIVFAAIGRVRADRQGVFGRLGPRRERIAEPAPDLTAALPKEAAVVAALFAPSHSPESMAEIGGALAEGGKVEVVHFTEVPEQMLLGETLDEGPHVTRLRRRVETLARERPQDVEFDAIVTRDVVQEIHDISRRVHCKWVLLPWRERSDWGVLPFTHMGWLIDHLACNLAIFKDEGIRYIREIVVLAEPGPHDALVATTAQRLAASFGARLTFVRYVESGAPPVTAQAEVDYMEELAKLCSLDPEIRVVRGDDELRALGEMTVGYDLLVMGAPPDLRLRHYLRGTFSERLTRAAGCSVLRLKAHRASTHHAIAPVGPSRRLTLQQHLMDGCIEARLEPMTKEALFHHIAKQFATGLGDSKMGEIEAAFWDREKKQNTAIEMGLAIPHATVAGVDRAYVGVFTSAQPIDYKAPDDVPVDVFFVTIGPPSERNTHLRILAAIAELVTETSILERLRAASSDDELRAALAPPSRSVSRRRRHGPL